MLASGGTLREEERGHFFPKRNKIHHSCPEGDGTLLSLYAMFSSGQVHAGSVLAKARARMHWRREKGPLWLSTATDPFHGFCEADLAGRWDKTGR